MTILAAWKRIAAWYKANTPPDTLQLAPGATKDQLAELQSLIGAELPEEFKESYSLHDGTGDSPFLCYGSLHSTSGIATEWNLYRQWQETKDYGRMKPTEVRSPLIKQVWWNRLRLPLTDNGGGDPVTLDLDPAQGGTRGQVIDFNHEVGPTDLLAANFGLWLEQIAADLEASKYVYDEDALQVQPVDW